MFRTLSGGVWLFSPWILEPKFRLSNQLWGAISSALLSGWDTDLITSETIRSSDMINVVSEKLLGKLVRKLGGCLSILPEGVYSLL